MSVGSRRRKCYWTEKITKMGKTTKMYNVRSISKAGDHNKKLTNGDLPPDDCLVECSLIVWHYDFVGLLACNLQLVVEIASHQHYLQQLQQSPPFCLSLYVWRVLSCILTDHLVSTNLCRLAVFYIWCVTPPLWTVYYTDAFQWWHANISLRRFMQTA